jgi:hypothetical protein
MEGIRMHSEIPESGGCWVRASNQFAPNRRRIEPFALFDGRRERVVALREQRSEGWRPGTGVRLLPPCDAFARSGVAVSQEAFGHKEIIEAAADAGRLQWDTAAVGGVV